LRPPLRFRALRDDVDRRRGPAALRDLAVVDRRDPVLFALPRECVRVLRDALTDFFGARHLGLRFRLALRLFVTFATVFVAAAASPRPLSAAFPARAPATPPTTAPIGPAMLPTAAPATAPAVCFGIGGISMFSDGWDVCFSRMSGLSAIDGSSSNIVVRLQP